MSGSPHLASSLDQWVSGRGGGGRQEMILPMAAPRTDGYPPTTQGHLFKKSMKADLLWQIRKTEQPRGTVTPPRPLALTSSRPLISAADRWTVPCDVKGQQTSLLASLSFFLFAVMGIEPSSCTCLTNTLPLSDILRAFESW